MGTVNLHFACFLAHIYIVSRHFEKQSIAELNGQLVPADHSQPETDKKAALDGAAEIRRNNLSVWNFNDGGNNRSKYQITP
jgi:hypothetical protein